MRRKDREITDREEIRAILERARVLHLGINAGGRPYVVPLHYGLAWSDGLPVTAEDVAFSFLIAADPDSANTALAMYSVEGTDDDGFVKKFGVFDEDEAEVGPVTGSDRLIGITDAGDINVSARRDIETEDTVHISHCADGSVAHDDNGRSHDGNTAFIDNCSGNGAVLGGRNRTQEARCDDHHSGSHSCKKLPCHKKR